MGFLKPKKNVSDNEFNDAMKNFKNSFIKFQISKLNISQEGKDMTFNAIKVIEKIIFNK